MVWNNPNHDTGPRQSGNNPPHLDAFFLALQKKVLLIFQRFGKKNPDGSMSEPPPWFGAALIAGFIILLWALCGIYIVGPAEEAVVLRFGRYHSSEGPGPHWAPRIIDKVYLVDKEKISTYSYDALMLTKDENIVSVAIAVQYRINNVRNYLFNGVDAHESLQQATASALRQVIGHTQLDLVLTSGRGQIRQEVRVLLEKILARYNVGLLVTDVAMQPAKAPEEVKEAFDDAIKAQEDEQRFKNQAQAYAMQVEPAARGQAQRLLADANAYKQQVVLLSKGDASRFLALLPEAKQSPQVTRTRLYIDTIQTVLQNANKLFIDDTNSNNVFYLPMDQFHSALPTTAAIANNQSKPIIIKQGDNQ